MDLILWRHAQAEDHAASGDDLARALTPYGHQQAQRSARWLATQLAPQTRVLCSPAQRTQQTAQALGRKLELHDELAPGATVAQLLELVQWPEAKSPCLVIGHQPVLGQTVAHLLGLRAGECSIRKGGVWWLRWRKDRDAASRTAVLMVVTPEMLGHEADEAHAP